MTNLEIALWICGVMLTCAAVIMTYDLLVLLKQYKKDIKGLYRWTESLDGRMCKLERKINLLEMKVEPPVPLSDDEKSMISNCDISETDWQEAKHKVKKRNEQR